MAQGQRAAVTHPSPKRVVRDDFPEKKVAISGLKAEQGGIPAEALSRQEEMRMACHGRGGKWTKELEWEQDWDGQN